MNGTIVDTYRLARRLRTLDFAAVEGSRPGIRIMELPTTRVRVRISGEGPLTLVFACDPPNVVEQYDDVIAQLAGRYRVVVMEQPGFGFSYPKPGFGFRRQDYAQAQHALLASLALAPYVLVAPCISAFHALLTAARAPALVHGLVLMQATSWPAQQAWVREVAKTFTAGTLGVPWGDRLGAIPYVAQAVNALTERSFPRLTHPFAVHRARTRPELLARFIEPGKRAFDQGACNCLQSLYQRYFEGDERSVPRPRQPTLVLWANGDYWHDNRNVKEDFPGGRSRLVRRVMGEVKSDKRGLLRYVPHASFAEVADTGHHLELENPTEVCSGSSGNTGRRSG